LCIAALNTPIEKASAQVFLNVLRDSLGSRRAASDMLIPRVDLTSLYPERAAEYLSQLGGTVTTGCAIKSVTQTETGWLLQKSLGDTQTFDGVVLATAPSAAANLLDTIDGITVPSLDYEPITTCYLQYANDTKLAHPMFA